MSRVTLESLKENLEYIPNNWVLVPVGANKAPYISNWSERHFTKADIIKEIDKPNSPIAAVGVQLGVKSGGLVCVDFDGEAAQELAKQLSNQDNIAVETITVTSGRTGRFSQFFYVDQKYWDLISTTRVSTDKPGQQLEFRWSGSQSVIFGEHPITGSYSWVNSPKNSPIQSCPAWVIDKMLKPNRGVSKYRFSDEELSPQKRIDIMAALYSLPASYADDYETWLKVGMALHSVGDASLLQAWDTWSQLSDKYEEDCCIKKWESFNHKSHGVTLGTLNYFVKKHEDERQELSDDDDDELNLLKADVEEYRKLASNKLNLFEVFPRSVARALNLFAKYTTLRAEATINPFLCVTASLHHTDTNITLLRKSRFTVPANLYAANVAASGEIKSPTAQTMMMKPLADLIKTANEEFLEAQRDYTESTFQYKAAKKDSKSAVNDLLEQFPDGQPKEPKLKLYIITNATVEGITAQFAAHPTKGLLYYRDELSGFVGSLGQYKGGKGDDRETFLEAYNGSSITVLRKEGVTVNVDNSSLSIYGTIQPEKLKEVFADKSDADGFWSRFLLINQPRRIAKLPDEDSSDSNIDIVEELKWFYKRIDRQPVLELKLSREAFKLYQEYYNQLEQHKFHSYGALANVYAKHEGLTGRLALNLHVLFELDKQPKNQFIYGVDIDTTVSGETMAKAIKLSMFYINEFKAMFSSLREELAPELVRILEVCEKKGGSISARDVIRSYDKQKGVTTKEVVSRFEQLAKLNYGTLSKAGRTITFTQTTSTVSNVNNCQEDVSEENFDETYTPYGVEPLKTQNVSNVSASRENKNIIGLLPGSSTEEEKDIPVIPTTRLNRFI
ncbi:DUF3987 domain-containing protein [Gloeocapsopsis sp. IPPAS B-1203]|uniref:DUF3987 domain-containing protein n=1 Tax=Gloeocapsopsis sp. IPPAS B-1203 TaxID=2049454 RepID=UPI000C19E287|nr:DUF3987 domain-containing protein [Gloeocapsopsis sp. IPPAS B-1203]PIG93725.1 hypothetical protein CSQ79_08835 [Gloeocapsopsis sp. IPPAS B-1203]